MSEDMLMLRKYAKLKNNDHVFIHLYNFSFKDQTNYITSPTFDTAVVEYTMRA